MLGVKPGGRWKALCTQSILLALSILLLNQQGAVYSAEQYRAENLFLTVYADGRVIVDYTVSLDVDLPRVTISIFGRLVEEMVVVNEEKMPVEYEVGNGTVTVDSLGSSMVTMTYTTSDLVNKKGGTWVLILDSPITFSVELPKDVTILGLSSIPLSISSDEDRYILTMKPGVQEISYTTGVVGTKEQASIAINLAEKAVEQAKAEGMLVEDAEADLDRAKRAYSEGRYVEAEQVAEKAKIALRTAATQTAEATQPFEALPSIWLYIGASSAAAAATAALFMMKRGGVKAAYVREVRSIDLDRILQMKPYLKLEDQEALQFLAEGGGEAFETELRERFKLPKTTIWRMVKRLEREGIVEVRKVGGQNLIRIREVYGG